MDNRCSTQSVCQRIRAINWQQEADYSKDSLHVRLMEEYLRRAGLWAKALGCESFGPFFNIAEQVDPTIRANTEILEWLETYTEQHCLGSRVSIPLQRILHWAALHDAGGLKTSHLPNPYEPLLTLYEQGAEFRQITGFIEVSGTGIPIQNWLRFSEEPPLWTEA